jgi:flagellar biosynthesis protein FliQ
MSELLRPVMALLSVAILLSRRHLAVVVIGLLFSFFLAFTQISTFAVARLPLLYQKPRVVMTISSETSSL